MSSTTETVHRAGFAFIQDLAGALNRNDVKLPSFPDIVIRIKRALEDDNCDIARLTRVVATEPALAARLLALANSALLQRGANKVRDLRTAVSRLGSQMLRNAAMTVAVEQIFLSSSLGERRERLRGVFRESTRVAALSYTIARDLTGFNPDEALMAGLLHNVGKLYILMRTDDHREFIDSEAALDAVMDQWHGQIGRAIIEGWGFGDDLAAAVADHADIERSAVGSPDLTDVITVAWLMSQPASKDLDLSSVRACRRLQLDNTKRARFIEQSQVEINALAAALSG